MPPARPQPRKRSRDECSVAKKGSQGCTGGGLSRSRNPPPAPTGARTPHTHTDNTHTTAHPRAWRRALTHIHRAATLGGTLAAGGRSVPGRRGLSTPAASVLDGDCPPSRQWRLSPTPPASVLPMRAGAQSLTPPRKGPIQPESVTPRRDYADFLHEGVSHAHSHVEAHTCIRQAGAPPAHRG